MANAGCRASEAVYVGDTPTADIEGGNRAGMRTALIGETTFGVKHSADGAEDKFIQELPELLEYVDSLQGTEGN